MALAFLPEFASSIGDSPVVVTGAGGWLGQAALELFATAVPLEQIYAFGARARDHALRDGRLLRIRALSELPVLPLREALIFHMAFLTREHAGTMPVPAYVDANRAISGLLEAYVRAYGARGLFVPSSGAAYTADPVHNPYGALKLEDEWRFAALGQELDLPVVAVRVFNLAGPFINKLDSYALACILRDLLAGRPVVLRAARPVWRGYAHVGDVLNIALGLMLRGDAPPVFDTWGEPVELSTLAARAAALLGKPLTIERPAWSNGAAEKYLGSATDYLAHAQALGLEPASLDQQIRDTADYLGKCLAM
jgi:nucleoside-diphosphate-sugar epimerase